MKYLFNTVEMFCKLDKDRNKVFKRKVDGLEIKILPRTHSNDNLPNCCYYWESGYPSLSPNDEWEEVPQEIPWQKAIESWARGKSVKCKMPTGNVEFLYEFTNEEIFKNDDGKGVSLDEILYGEWYVV